MATKFRIIGTSDIYGKVTVNIGLTGYVGAVLELDGAGRDWIELKIGSGSDILNPVLSGEVQINFYVKTNFITIELGQAEAYQYSIDILDLADEVIWSGWVDPEDYSESYTSLPYLVSLKGSDGLDGLKTATFENLTGSNSLFDYLLQALAGTQLSLPIFEAVNIYSNGMLSGSADSPLKQAEVDSSTFLAFGDTANCFECLEAILLPLFCRIYQYRGWQIENIQQKSGSYIRREYTSAGVYVGFESFDPIIEMDTSVSIFRGLVNKSGSLSFNPALRNAEVYLTTVEATGETTTGGFQTESDWIDADTLASWTVVSGVVGIIIERVIANYSGNLYAVKIPDKQPTQQPNYIESNSYPLTVADFDTIDIKFSHRFDYPAIIIAGSRPVLFFQVILETSFLGFPSTYYWSSAGWSLNVSSMRIENDKRRKWKDYAISIGSIPGDGNVKFRFYKLVKSGSADTEVRLTGWKTNLKVAQPTNEKILLEGATTGAVTSYKGPSFQHYISDGLVQGVAGVMDVGGVLTATWNRRGKTDNLNIRRLFLLQWLSMNSSTSTVLSGDFFQKGEQIVPWTVIKDKDSISSRKYLPVSMTIGLGSGFSRNVYREIFDTDAVPTYFEEAVDQPRENDYFISPIRITVPGLTDGANLPNFTLPEIVFPDLNGDVSGEPSNARLNPSAILSKGTLDTTGLTASDIVFNAVKNEESGQEMTKLSLEDSRILIIPEYGRLNEILSPTVGGLTITSIGSKVWRDLVYGGGIYVLINSTPTGFQVLTSTDLITWTGRSSSEQNVWVSITYGNGLFVAVSEGGTNRIMTSPDGISWTGRSSIEANVWQSIAYGNGLFIAVSLNGTNRVLKSTDGISWSVQSVGSVVCYGVDFVNNLFIITGVNLILTSPDGLVWTARTAPSSVAWRQVAYGNSVYVGIAITGELMISTDSINWSLVTIPTIFTFYSIAFGGSNFVVVGLGSVFMYSSNGINWSYGVMVANRYSVIFAEGLFISIGTGSTFETLQEVKTLSHSQLNLDDGRNPHGTRFEDLEGTPPSGDQNVDGGTWDSVYLPTQNLDGGSL